MFASRIRKICEAIITFIITALIIAASFFATKARAQNNTWQALQPKRNNVKASLRRAAPELPAQSDIVIHTPFQGALTSLVGPTPSFTRTGSKTFATSKSTLSTASTGTPMFNATVFGGTDSAASGIQISAEIENLLLYSDAFDQSPWTITGTATVIPDTATDPFGGTTADTILSGSSGGVIQDTGISSVNAGFPFHTTAWIWGVKAKTNTGFAIYRLRLSDGGTEEKIQTCYADTTFRPCEIYHQFTAASAGTVRVSVLVDNSSALRFSNAQLQRAGSTGYGNLRARAGMGTYVPTGATTTFANADLVKYPSSIMDTLRSQGSISFWFKPSRDGTSINEGNILSYFSLASEQFSLYEDSTAGMTLWIGNTPNSFSFSPQTQGMGFRKHVWNHAFISWNDASNRKRVYVNGVKFVDNTNAFSPWPSGNDLFLGQHSSEQSFWNSGAVFRDFVAWDIELGDTEAAQAKAFSSVALAETYPTGTLFELDPGVSLTPTVAQDYQYWYDSTLVQNSYSGTGEAKTSYFSSPTTYAQTDSNQQPTASYIPFRSGGRAMFQANSFNKNWLLRSTEPATSPWTATGAAVVLDNVGNAAGALLPYGTITGVAGDGITQTRPYAIADTNWAGQIYVRVASGTLAGDLRIGGDAGGTPQTETVSFTANSTDWTQVPISKVFTGAGSGNIKFDVILQGTGTLQITGMALEKRQAGFTTSNIRYPLMFIKTQASEVQQFPNYLWYNTTNMNPRQGTLIAWASLDVPTTAIADSDGPNVFSVVGDACAFDLHYVDNNFTFCMGQDVNNAITAPALNIPKHQVTQYGVTWECNILNSCTMALYIDGALIGSNTFANVKIPGHSRIVLGKGIAAQLATDSWKGQLGYYKILGAPDGAAITANWNAMKASYGR